MTPQDIPYLKEQIEGKTPTEAMAWFLKEFGAKIALSNSMGAEDQVLTDMICKIDKSARIFTLDTGRIFPETYDLIDRTNKRYGIQIQVYFLRLLRLKIWSKKKESIYFTIALKIGKNAVIYEK